MFLSGSCSFSVKLEICFALYSEIHMEREPQTTEQATPGLQPEKGEVTVKKYVEAPLSDGGIAGILIDKTELSDEATEACIVTPHYTVIYESPQSVIASLVRAARSVFTLSRHPVN
jgi:hypothetical protein